MLCLAKWGHAGCYSRWTSSLFCFVRGSESETGRKNVTHASLKQKRSIALVRADCGGMHIVLTWEHWEMDKRRWFRNTLLCCQSKPLSQKGRHYSWNGTGMGLQGQGNAGNLCFDTWCQVFIHMISSAAVFRTWAASCCRQDNAYTNSNHAKHFFLFALNWHNPSHSLTTKPCNTTGLMFATLVWRLFWSVSIYFQHPNGPTMHSHMRWIPLFVYWSIILVNFLPGSHVWVHPRVTRAHGNSNGTEWVGGLAACTSAVS